VVDESVVDLGVEGVDVAPQAWRWEQTAIGVGAEGVDEGS
jgi:hypothetical protein